MWGNTELRADYAREQYRDFLATAEHDRLVLLSGLGIGQPSSWDQSIRGKVRGQSEPVDFGTGKETTVCENAQLRAGHSAQAAFRDELRH